MPDIKIRDNTYAGVPAVTIPLDAGGGNAEFVYTGDATLDDAGKLPSGVTAYANSVKYTGTAPENDSSDLTVSGATVTAPAGIYYANATKAVASGSVTAPATISGSSATVSTGTNTLTLSKTIGVTPDVTTQGYISAGTEGNAAISLTASVTTKAATTITPSTSNQTVASGTYLTGALTVEGDADLKAENIVAGKNIFNIEGTAQIPVITQDGVTKVLSIS